MMRLVDNPVRHYAWGSVDAIPRLLGVPPDGRPQAELWLGAHERAASRVAGPHGSACLLDLVRDDPHTQLGARWAHERRMPFLAKVIASARPLSLQVHPDARRAARWYAAEERQGLSPGDPRRTCPDDVAKVEMVWALSEFRAICGFRTPAEAAEWLDALDLPALAPTAKALHADGVDALRPGVQRLLEAPDPAALVAGISAAARELLDDRRWGWSAQVAAELAARHPDDAAVAMALLLRPVRLQPGSAMFIATGQPHSYLSGTGFEVQANSDNVLRAGLTDKHVDVDRLVDAVDVTADGVCEVAGDQQGAEQVFAPDTARFALGVVRRAVPGVPLAPASGPQVLFCVDGEFRVATGDDRLVLAGGQSAFVPAGAASLGVAGEGTLLRVTTGREQSGRLDVIHGPPPDRYAGPAGPDRTRRQTA